MELNVIENTKYKIVAELKGEDHTFCNILVKELQNNKDIKVAVYKIEHPLRRVPRLLLETNTNTTAKKALFAAIEAVRKKALKFQKEFKSAF